MNTIKVTRTYLQMFKAPDQTELHPLPETFIEELENIEIDDYIKLYEAVGADLNWVDRKLMHPDELLAILNDPKTLIFLLKVKEQIAGYTELYRHDTENIELAYFGLSPSYRGKGLGKYLLHFSIQKAFEFKPKRLWLHTCSLDHPNAIVNYQKRGFKIYKEEQVEQIVLAQKNGGEG
ncbi:MAG: GNAT family N-acetyltransferase [Candidatus Cyclobacteriaceae bacterium M3_2C_046]